MEAVMFQSTLLREERRREEPKIITNLTVSIHAPARGATLETIHNNIIDLFQSTLLREERLKDRKGFMQEVVSIHAPARGATILGN